jgi:AcrR family transcriptional regulator
VSPRPKQASDDDILRAAFRAIAQLGPAKLTLAAVAAEAGLTAAALVQRFGSKRALLLAAAADAAGGDAYIFPELRRQHSSAVAAILALADCMAVLVGPTPTALAHNLAFLQIDLADADFHRHTLARSRGMRAGIRDLVRDAVAAGELVRCDPDRVASALQATLNGSLVTWAVHREGTLAAWVRRDLQTMLARWRTPRGQKRRARRAR